MPRVELQQDQVIFNQGTDKKQSGHTFEQEIVKTSPYQIGPVVGVDLQLDQGLVVGGGKFVPVNIAIFVVVVSSVQRSCRHGGK
jgi:hypothetical protein